MNSPEDRRPDGPRFTLGMTGPDGMLFCEGRRQIDLQYRYRTLGDGGEYEISAYSLRRWRHPYDMEPITNAIRQEILEKIKQILEHDSPRITVKIWPADWPNDGRPEAW